MSDTAFYVNVQGSTPSHEYFLLENRQASQADTALIRIHCQRAALPATCPGGMLVWHADSLQLASSGFHTGNAVNVGPVHGLAVEEADGLRQLWCGGGCNRGDAGDYYPGKSGNTAFSVNTNPRATTNLDGSFIGFAIDSIRQVVPGGQMAFRLRFGDLTIVRGSDTNAIVSVDAANYNVYRNLLDNGSTHTVSIADTQASGASNRTRWRFASWSDGGLRTHGITGALSGGTVIANLNRDFKLIATAGAGGTIASSPVVNLAGEFIAEGNAVQLTATPDSGLFFGCWSGDTLSSDTVLTLPMSRPYTVAAAFASALAISSGAARPNGVVGAVYADTLRVTGGSGTNSWSVTGGALPQGVTLDAATGVVSGFPRQSGSFSYTATALSCTQSQSRDFAFSTTAPALTTADVVAQILGPTAPLDTDQVRYLDFQGNNNGAFDVGDFLAWVKATGAPLSAAAMARPAQRKGGRP